MSETLIVVDDMESNTEVTEDSKSKTKEVEFGASRGLDFKKVKTVINFDPPTNLNGYIHRFVYLVNFL